MARTLDTLVTVQDAIDASETALKTVARDIPYGTYLAYFERAQIALREASTSLLRLIDEKDAWQ